jgi:hypothetical protein
MENEPQLWNGNLIYGLLLVVSNVAIFPAIFLAARRGRMTTVLLYCNTFIASVAYHYCRAFDQCLATYEMHITTDYLSVYMVIVWILTTLGL